MVSGVGVGTGADSCAGFGLGVCAKAVDREYRITVAKERKPLVRTRTSKNPLLNCCLQCKRRASQKVFRIIEGT